MNIIERDIILPSHAMLDGEKVQILDIFLCELDGEMGIVIKYKKDDSSISRSEFAKYFDFTKSE